MRPLLITCFGSILLLCGCGLEKPNTPSWQPSYLLATVVAVTAPDSAVLGQHLVVKVRWFHAGGYYFDHFETRSANDTLYVHPVIRDEWGRPGVSFPAIVSIDEADYVTPVTASKHLTIQVASDPLPFILPVTIGVAPALIRRLTTQLEDPKTGAPIGGAIVVVTSESDRSADSTYFPPDTLGKYVSDDLGMGSLSWDCASGTRLYEVVLLSDRGFLADYYISTPALCGVPERTIWRPRP